MTQPSQEQHVPSEESNQRLKRPCGKHLVFMGLCLMVRTGDGSHAGPAGLWICLFDGVLVQNW